MFKEPEKGEKDVNMERTEEALEIKPDYIAVSCPFCMTMLSDGVKLNNKESEVSVKDIAELIAEAVDL
jgi:Fe-S oxidoreductase